jgi:hypothetical protein
MKRTITYRNPVAKAMLQERKSPQVVPPKKGGNAKRKSPQTVPPKKGNKAKRNRKQEKLNAIRNEELH